MKRLAVYCGSASPADPRYIELAEHVGAELARRGIGVVHVHTLGNKASEVETASGVIASARATAKLMLENLR